MIRPTPPTRAALHRAARAVCGSHDFDDTSDRNAPVIESHDEGGPGAVSRLPPMAGDQARPAQSHRRAALDPQSHVRRPAHGIQRGKSSMNPSVDQQISRRVREVRISKGVSADTVATWLGLKDDEYADREAGDVAFNLLELIELSRRLGVPTFAFTRAMLKARAA